MIPSGDTNPGTHASELELHRLALGELPAERRAGVEAHARACPTCAEALAALHLAHESFDRDVHARTAPALAERARGGWTRHRAAWVWLVSAPAAALVVLVGWGVLRNPALLGPDLRTKGPGETAAAPVALEVFARRGEQVFAVSSQTPLEAGDAIRFVIRKPPALGHLLVVGVDAGGAVTVYHPFGGARSAELGADGRVEVTGSITLDDRPGPERLFALLSRQPIALGAVKPALDELAAGGAAGLRAGTALPAAVDGQASILLERLAP